MTKELEQTWHAMLSLTSPESPTVACDAPVEREKRPRDDNHPWKVGWCPDERRLDCCADVLEGSAECTTFRPMKKLNHSGRYVVPRLSGVDSTIPATSRALVQAGRELSPAVTEAEIAPVPPKEMFFRQESRGHEFE